MATLNSDIVTATAPAKWFTTDKSTYGVLVVPDQTTPTIGDIWNLCLIPANSQIADFVIDLPDLDSGTQLTISVEDDKGAVLPGTTTVLTTPTVYVAASTAGQAGGIITMANLAHGVLGSSYPGQQTFRLLIAATAAGAITGPLSIYFKVTFSPT